MRKRLDSPDARETLVPIFKTNTSLDSHRIMGSSKLIGERERKKREGIKRDYQTTTNQNK